MKYRVAKKSAKNKKDRAGDSGTIWWGDMYGCGGCDCSKTAPLFSFFFFLFLYYEVVYILIFFSRGYLMVKHLVGFCIHETGKPLVARCTGFTDLVIHLVGCLYTLTYCGREGGRV